MPDTKRDLLSNEPLREPRYHLDLSGARSLTTNAHIEGKIEIPFAISDLRSFFKHILLALKTGSRIMVDLAKDVEKSHNYYLHPDLIKRDMTDEFSNNENNRHKGVEGDTASNGMIMTFEMGKPSPRSHGLGASSHRLRRISTGQSSQESITDNESTSISARKESPDSIRARSTLISSISKFSSACHGLYVLESLYLGWIRKIVSEISLLDEVKDSKSKKVIENMDFYLQNRSPLSISPQLRVMLERMDAWVVSMTTDDGRNELKQRFPTLKVSELVSSTIAILNSINQYADSDRKKVLSIFRLEKLSSLSTSSCRALFSEAIFGLSLGEFPLIQSRREALRVSSSVSASARAIRWCLLRQPDDISKRRFVALVAAGVDGGSMSRYIFDPWAESRGLPIPLLSERLRGDSAFLEALSQSSGSTDPFRRTKLGEPGEDAATFAEVFNRVLEGVAQTSAHAKRLKHPRSEPAPTGFFSGHAQRLRDVLGLASTTETDGQSPAHTRTRTGEYTAASGPFHHVAGAIGSAVSGATGGITGGRSPAGRLRIGSTSSYKMGEDASPSTPGATDSPKTRPSPSIQYAKLTEEDKLVSSMSGLRVQSPVAARLTQRYISTPRSMALLESPLAKPGGLEGSPVPAALHAPGSAPPKIGARFFFPEGDNTTNSSVSNNDEIEGATTTATSSTTAGTAADHGEGQVSAPGDIPPRSGSAATDSGPGREGGSLAQPVKYALTPTSLYHSVRARERQTNNGNPPFVLRPPQPLHISIPPARTGATAGERVKDAAKGPSSEGSNDTAKRSTQTSAEVSGEASPIVSFPTESLNDLSSGSRKETPSSQPAAPKAKPEQEKDLTLGDDYANLTNTAQNLRLSHSRDNTDSVSSPSSVGSPPSMQPVKSARTKRLVTPAAMSAVAAATGAAFVAASAQGGFDQFSSPLQESSVKSSEKASDKSPESSLEISDLSEAKDDEPAPAALVQPCDVCPMPTINRADREETIIEVKEPEPYYSDVPKGTERLRPTNLWSSRRLRRISRGALSAIRKPRQAPRAPVFNEYKSEEMKEAEGPEKALTTYESLGLLDDAPAPAGASATTTLDATVVQHPKEGGVTHINDVSSVGSDASSVICGVGGIDLAAVERLNAQSKAKRARRRKGIREGNRGAKGNEKARSTTATKPRSQRMREALAVGCSPQTFRDMDLLGDRRFFESYPGLEPTSSPTAFTTADADSSPAIIYSKSSIPRSKASWGSEMPGKAARAQQYHPRYHGPLAYGIMGLSVIPTAADSSLNTSSSSQTTQIQPRPAASSASDIAQISEEQKDSNIPELTTGGQFTNYNPPPLPQEGHAPMSKRNSSRYGICRDVRDVIAPKKTKPKGNNDNSIADQAGN